MSECNHNFKEFKKKEVESRIPNPSSTTVHYQVRCVKCGISLDRIKKKTLKEEIADE